MKKKYKRLIIILLICAIVFLAIGASFHGFRTSGDEHKFVIGVAMGITMISLCAICCISAIVVLILAKKAPKNKQ